MGRGGAGGAAKGKSQKASLGGAKSRKAAEEKVAAPKTNDESDFNPANHHEAIRGAYLELSNGQSVVRIRIADLRDKLQHIPRHELDASLLGLSSAGHGAVYRLDNPAEIGPRDKAGVLKTPSGEERHILYMHASRPISSPHNIDSKTFAKQVKDAAVRSAAQRPAFGDKVFIHDAHREYVKEHGPMPLNEFKAKLVEANNARHLDLSRADLVEAMSKHDVATSETSHLNATFNFIRLRDNSAKHETAILRAYHELGNGESNVRVRIADLHAKLPHVPLHELHESLLHMETNGKASAYNLDNPREIGARDRAAEMRTPSGERRHIIYIGRGS